MMVSTKGRYALRVMIDLAEHQSEGYVPLKEIAARQEISEKYLESILKVLVQQRFLEGLRPAGRGPHRGPGKRQLPHGPAGRRQHRRLWRPDPHPRHNGHQKGAVYRSLRP